MRNKRTEISELKTRLVLAGITVVAMIVVAGTNHADDARGAGMRAESKLLVASEPKSSPHTKGASQAMIQLSAQDASWSPDGKRLVFAQGSELYLADGLGGEARQVYSGRGLVVAPRFLAGGQRIRFTIKDQQRNIASLWEVSRDGSNAHPVRAE